jgi:hypothetical protein
MRKYKVFGGKDDFVEAKALAGPFCRKWQGARISRNPGKFRGSDGLDLINRPFFMLA